MADTFQEATRMVEKIRTGLYEERELVAFIKQHLLTTPQEHWLHEKNLDLYDILNGRFHFGEGFITQMFEEWNAKLGAKLFNGIL